MAHVHRFGLPENKSESKAIRYLADKLPEHYLLFHNFELTTGYGLPYEYDIAVVGDFAVWHVEVKGYRGNIRGNMNQWIFDNGRVQPSPIPLANKKSKILASKLKRARKHLDRVWVDTAIVLTDDRAKISIQDDQKTRVMHLNEAAGHLMDPDSLPVKPSPIHGQHADISRALFGDARASQHLKQVGLYDITERISQSDHQTVFLARHRFVRTRPETILKVYHFDVYSEADARRRQIEAIFHYQDAMRLLGAHPNIIHTSDMFAWEGDKFVLPTEFVDQGRPLVDVLDEDGEKVTWAEKADWVAKIARGLRHCHHNGVVHRNIRPLNVVVGPDGVVKLVNFDLALIDQTPHPQLGGRLEKRLDPHYVAPEVWADPTTATPASDIYSLGILFYRLITGEEPYEDVTALGDETPLDREKLMAALAAPESKSFMTAPEDVVEVLGRMTRQRAADRYQEMDEVLEDLSILKDD